MATKKDEYRKLPLSRAKRGTPLPSLYAIQNPVLPTSRKVRNIALSGNFTDKIKWRECLHGTQCVNEPSDKNLFSLL